VARVRVAAVRRRAPGALASIRLGELRPLRWAILDEFDRRWLLVQSEYRSAEDGGTVTLILRTEESVRRSARIEP
jgi:hypothetical protein